MFEERPVRFTVCGLEFKPEVGVPQVEPGLQDGDVKLELVAYSTCLVKVVEKASEGDHVIVAPAALIFK